jgi:hypothetical protein
MGDFLLVHDESGKKYFRRIIYVNILFYAAMGALFILYIIDLLILVLGAIGAALASFAYAIYFILKNPPEEVDKTQTR